MAKNIGKFEVQLPKVFEVQLPKVKIGNKDFFKDDTKKQYRNTKNYHETYTFEEMGVVFRLLDVGEQLIKTISTEAERLGMIIQVGQSMTNEDVLHIITPDRELITVIRDFEPDEEILKQIIGDDENEG